MIDFIWVKCFALCLYLVIAMLVSTTPSSRPSTFVLADRDASATYTIQKIRRLKIHSVFEGKNSRMRERKQWFKIIEQKYSAASTEKDTTIHGASKETGYGKGSKGYGKGKGKGMMMSKNMKGKGKGSRLPKICRELDFENYEDDDGLHGKGMGKSKSNKGKEKDKGSKAGMGKGLDKGNGVGKGKGSYEEEGCRRNIYKKIKRIPDISIFVDLIEQAELEEIFMCNGPFTVLAPSNAVFMNNTVVTRYLSDVTNVDELREVLLYHILPGRTLIDEFTKGFVDTLLDADIRVAINPVVFNQKAGIEEGDFKACNGVIHIVDDILLPPGTIVMTTSSWDNQYCIQFIF